jgi:hypothetical protein
MTNLLLRFEKLPLLDREFDVSITLKGLDGVLELIGGVLLLFLTPHRLNAIVAFLTQHELSEDPKDFLATHLVSYAQSFSASASLFLAVYLLSHGIVQDHPGGGPTPTKTVGIPLDDCVFEHLYRVPNLPDCAPSIPWSSCLSSLRYIHRRADGYRVPQAPSEDG